MWELKRISLIFVSAMMVLALSNNAVVSNYPAQITYSYIVYMPIIADGRFSFLETFDGMPPSPQPWKPADWDVTVHSRDVANMNSLTPMQADHGTQCEPPPATHPTNTYAGAVFICHDHVMTAINDEEYGAIYLTPNSIVDFSSGQAVIKFDLSTRRTSDRDWIDIWVTPFMENLQLPLNSWLPDLNGPPRRAVHIRMDFPSTNTTFLAEVIHNFNPTPVIQKLSLGYETVLTPSPTRRDTFELDISQNHLKFGMPQYNLWWIDQDIPSLDWSQGVVQFGHHSYTPDKACNYNGTCGPNTWHWDNVTIYPAIPFRIIRANQRNVNSDTSPLVNLASPSPANAYLRFSGIGSSLQVSYDNGATWKPAQLQAQMEQIEEHYKSYWMPIPAGISRILFRGQNYWGGGWQVQDISVWSQTTN